jgi:hypothetical protein
MARPDEFAEGIAAVLAHGAEPEPLPISFSGHSPAEIAFLAGAACERAGRPLARVRRAPGRSAGAARRRPVQAFPS